MAVRVAMNYNVNTKAITPTNASRFRLIAYGEVEGNANSDAVELFAGRTYVLVSTERTTSTGAVYGYRAILISTPGDDLFGSTAASHGNLVASTNSGISITYNMDGSLTITGAASTRTVSYAIYKLI